MGTRLLCQHSRDRRNAHPRICTGGKKTKEKEIKKLQGNLFDKKQKTSR